MVLTEPIFINTDPNQIVNDLIAVYEAATNTTISPAQAERIMINAIAYRESLYRSDVNAAAKLNLVAFASGVILDYLGDLVGAKRLPAQPAICDIDFTLVSGHGAVVIPLGTRISSQDGKAVFRTTEATPVSIGVNDVTVPCECEIEGVSGNGYAGGNISVILDPLAYLSDAANALTTSGGADEETDEQFRIRIQLAPASFSTAGSYDGYKFYARSAHQNIIDVEVISPYPGTVNVYPLTLDIGGTPSPIIDIVEAKLSPQSVRALNDEVVVISPTSVNFSIDFDVELFADADQASTLELMEDAAQNFADQHREKLGRDIIIDQIKSLIIIPGAVYKIAAVNQPTADIILNQTQYGECTAITINITGINNG